MNNPKLSLLASAAPSGVAFSFAGAVFCSSQSLYYERFLSDIRVNTEYNFAGATFSPKPWGQRTVHSRDIRVKVERFFADAGLSLRNLRSSGGPLARHPSSPEWEALAAFSPTQVECFGRFLSDIRVNAECNTAVAEFCLSAGWLTDGSLSRHPRKF